MRSAILGLTVERNDALNTAKKIKADLIEKAKIKKQYFKSVKGAEGSREGQEEDLFDRNEGKFAPEKRDADDTSDDILFQMRNRDLPAPSASTLQYNKANGIREKKKRTPAIKDGVDDARSSTRQGGQVNAGPADSHLSKEERTRLREKKQEKWNSQSGSQMGRTRGQPNLGARMDLLLEKIKQG
jgi:hypothetical protein